MALQQGLDRTPRPPRQPAPRQPAMADTGADESPTTALLRVAAAEMAGDEESDPTTPTLRVSQRQRQPTGRVREEQERRQEQRQRQPRLPPYKGKTPRRSKEARLPKHRKDLGGGALTLPLDDPRRRNPSEQYGLESHEAIRPNGNERGGGRERLWEWSQQRNTLYKRRDDAEARVAARKQRKQDEWNAEVAEYGEEEARARRDLEREAAKAADDLMTSEIAEMDLEDQVANPMLTINASLRVDKKPEWSHHVGRCRLWEVDITTMLEQPLWAVLEERGNEYGWEVDSRTVTIRSQHTRAKRQKQSLSDFDHASWELINNLCLAESDRWGPQDIDVAIEIVGHSTIKRPRRGVADAPTTIPNDATGATGARTRTDRLLDQQEARRQQAREEGNYDLDIIDRWQCHDPDCPNENGFCFVDYSDKHYTITASQSQLWSKAMATGEPGVTVLRPPTRLSLCLAIP